MSFAFEPIGYVLSGLHDRIVAPRQPGLARALRGIIELRDEPHWPQALEGLQGFSHIWIVWIFDRHGARAWRPSVRPPRLGGARKMGVLATRSPHRPNPIGLSVVELCDIDWSGSRVRIHVRGIDMLNNTPVLDIKPYLPYADSPSSARTGWVDEPLTPIEVVVQPHVEEQLAMFDPRGELELRAQVLEILSTDPRPSFQRTRWPVSARESEGRRFGFRFASFDVQYTAREGRWEILAVRPYDRERIEQEHLADDE